MTKEFTQRKIFEPIGNLSQADFVFLAYSEYGVWGLPYLEPWVLGPRDDVLTQAEGFAVSPDDYSRGLVSVLPPELRRASVILHQFQVARLIP